MNTDKLKSLIETSELNQMQKNIHLGFVARAEDYENNNAEVRELIKIITNEKKSFGVVLSSDEIKMYEVLNSNDEWDIKYPFRCIYFDGKNWKGLNTICDTKDNCYLMYIGEKYLGGNNQFGDFAMKMLEIKVKE